MKPTPVIKSTAASLILSVLLSGCTHYYYVANVQNVPLFKEKNEYRLAAFMGGGDETSCAELQAACSVTDHLGIMANYMRVTGGNFPEGNNAKGNYIEAALGYYKPMLNNSSVFEVYGGIGGGNQHHQYLESYMGQNYGTSELSSMRLFIQPSFGISYNIFDVAFSTRISRLTFTSVHNYTLFDSDDYIVLNTLSKKDHFFLEPAFTVRGGWKNIKVQFQVAHSDYLNKPKLDFGEEWHISLGLNVALAARFKTAAGTQKH